MYDSGEQAALPQRPTLGEQSSVPSRLPGWDLWLWWILASAAGSFIGQAAWLLSPRDGCLYFVSSIAPAFIRALFHWIVLRRYLLDFGLWSWVGVTVLGSLAIALLGGLLGFLYLTSAPFPLSAADIQIYSAIRESLLLALLGLAQWLILRRYSTKAIWWVLAYGAVGMFQSMQRAILPRPPLLTGTGELSAENLAIGSLIGSFEGGFIFGVITGLVLVWLLRYPFQPLRGSS